MRVVITGDKGFVGEETKKYLRSKKITQIFGYDVMDGNDIRNIKNFENFIEDKKPDRILHLAAIARFAEADKNPLLAYETNVLGTQNVASVAIKYNIPLVYASTGSVYMPIEENPPITEEFKCRGNSIYGCTKYFGEIYVAQHSPNIILRYAHLYGKEKRGHGLIGGFLSRIERGLSPTLYGGKQSNDFTYIKDVAQANYLALTATWDKWNQVYNIGTGEELTAEKAGSQICKLANFKGKIEVKTGRTVDPERFVYNIEKAKSMLGFRPKYKFEDGLKDMLK